MAIRDKIIDNARPFLEPGETPQAAFAGQTFSQYWALLSIIIVLFKNAYRSVVVTDRRIIIFDTGRWSSTKAKAVRSVLPRETVIGPPSGLWWKSNTLGEQLYVHRRFHKDVEQADSLIGAVPSSSIPAPPVV